jgi:hypothetical protein
MPGCAQDRPRDPDLNCDECPFASTREGASTGRTVSSGTAYVAASSAHEREYHRQHQHQGYLQQEERRDLQDPLTQQRILEGGQVVVQPDEGRATDVPLPTPLTRPRKLDGA